MTDLKAKIAAAVPGIPDFCFGCHRVMEERHGTGYPAGVDERGEPAVEEECGPYVRDIRTGVESLIRERVAKALRKAASLALARTTQSRIDGTRTAAESIPDELLRRADAIEKGEGEA